MQEMTQKNESLTEKKNIMSGQMNKLA